MLAQGAKEKAAQSAGIAEEMAIRRALEKVSSLELARIIMGLVVPD